VRSIPQEVRFHFEARRVRTVPVEVRFMGELQSGYEIAHRDVEPHEVRIVGPRSRVGRVSAAVTDMVDLSGVVGSSEFHVNLLVDDAFVRMEGPSEAIVRVTMKKK
jgi:YbbR domain-containing protein